MASFNQNPLGQAAVDVSIGATFYDASPLGVGTITPAEIIDFIPEFSIDIAGTSQLRLPLGGGGDTRPSVGFVYPR